MVAVTIFENLHPWGASNKYPVFSEEDVKKIKERKKLVKLRAKHECI